MKAVTSPLIIALDQQALHSGSELHVKPAQRKQPSSIRSDSATIPQSRIDR